MPIETKIEGEPESVRAAARWLRSDLATGVDTCTDHVLRAGSAAGDWHGSAGDGFRTTMSETGRSGAELAAEAEKIGQSFDSYADDLQTAKNGMERARQIATAGGLTVAGTVIQDPGPAPAAPGAVPTGAAATPSALAAHGDAVAAQAEHAKKVEAYHQAEQEAKRSQSVLERAQAAGAAIWAAVKVKPFQKIASAANGATKAGLAKYASRLDAKADQYALRAALARKHMAGSPAMRLTAAHADAMEASLRNKALLPTKLVGKLPIVGHAITLAGVGYDIETGKPAGRTVVVAGASTGASLLVAGALAGAPFALPAIAAVGAGVVVGMGAKWAYEHLPTGVQEKVDAGTKFAWDHAMHASGADRAIDVGKKVWNKVFG